MRNIQVIIILLLLSVFYSCTGAINLGKTNVTDMPEWYTNQTEYKNYDPENRIYGRGFGENQLMLSDAMDTADDEALADIARQIASYVKRKSTITRVAANVKTVRSGERKKRNNININAQNAEQISNRVIDNLAQALLVNPKREISDHWETKRDGITVYRSWALWSVPIESLENTLLTHMEDDPEFYDSIRLLYLEE